jgi:hypothetical protein
MAKQPKLIEADLGVPSGSELSGGGGSGIPQDWIDALDDLVTKRLPTLPQISARSPGALPVSQPPVGRENLVGALIGERITDGMPTGERALQVFVLRKENNAALIDPSYLFEGGYDYNGKKYPVDVVALSQIYGGPTSDVFTPKYGVEIPPVQCGSCIGNDVTGDTGTLGCLVVDNDNNVCILSNAHVMAQSGAGQPSEKVGKKKADKIVAPGAATRFPDPFPVGYLLRFQTIDFAGGENTVDAALASTAFMVAKPTMHASFTLTPQLQNEPRIGMIVYKQGARTGSTYGQIVGLYGALDIPYKPAGVSSVARFVRQLVIVGLGGPFSGPGDSGSLVVENTTRRPVGLLFAGGTASDGKDYTFANPIVNVKNALKIFSILDKEPPNT